LTKEEGKRSIEALKRENGIPNNVHLKIRDNGDVIGPKGDIIGNLFDFL
jgi:hypothetical protein